ncbi:hypothetical protein Scep_016650 [Stephania cephalantha]|uniref:Hexosyltransferase n=1 Tax=Stephania cephalantha TaxID=152367 RepID=A0AAP0IN78_9MAGN
MYIVPISPFHIQLLPPPHLLCLLLPLPLLLRPRPHLLLHPFRPRLPLNYASNYLPYLLPLCLRRVVYLDSNLLLVDDIAKLSATPLSSSIVLAVLEYCSTNFTSYFTPTFWSNPALSFTFFDRRPCYFNTGVMVIDLQRWCADGYTVKIEEWMELQKRMRIYELGSLPPFLLVFAGNIAPWITGGTSTASAVTIFGAYAGICIPGRSASCIGVGRGSPGLVHLLKCSGSSPPCLLSQSTKTCLHSPLSRAKSSTGFIEFGFGLFAVPHLSGESGFGSIGRSAAAIGRVLGEFGFGFFDHSLPVVFWDQ